MSEYDPITIIKRAGSKDLSVACEAQKTIVTSVGLAVHTKVVDNSDCLLVPDHECDHEITTPLEVPLQYCRDANWDGFRHGIESAIEITLEKMAAYGATKMGMAELQVKPANHKSFNMLIIVPCGK